MNFKTTKTLAAFGGVGLGVLNLGLTVYRDFLRKPSLKSNIETASVRCIEEGDFLFLIKIIVQSKNGACYVRDIFLRHPEEIIGTYSSANVIHLNYAYKFTKQDLLELPADELSNHLAGKVQERMPVRDLKIDSGSSISLLFADGLVTKRFPDGFEDFPLEDWELVIDYGDKTEILNMSWTPHSKSKKGYWLRRDHYSKK